MNINALAAKMLRDYSESLGNAGCNDYPVDNDESGKALARALGEWCDDDEESFEPNDNDDKIYLLDWMVAAYLADQLEKR